MPIMEDYKQGLTTDSSNVQADVFKAPANTLEARAAATNGCVGFLSVLQICWEFKGNAIDVTLKLLGVTIGQGTLSPTNTTIKLGGSAAGFTAEVTLTLDITALSLKICGKACAPIVGCKQGCTTIHV